VDAGKASITSGLFFIGYDVKRAVPFISAGSKKPYSYPASL
jgi:hypothetical protein